MFIVYGERELENASLFPVKHRNAGKAHVYRDNNPTRQVHRWAKRLLARFD